MWLEIEDTIIVGVHSDRCDSNKTWIEHLGDAKPGDQWINGKLIPFIEKRNIELENRIAARNRITKYYPEWKQLNILREGNSRKIEAMGKFIDACRKWSNGKSAHTAQLEKINP